VAFIEPASMLTGDNSANNVATVSGGLAEAKMLNYCTNFDSVNDGSVLRIRGF